MASRRLRFAVLCDDLRLPAWQACAVNKLVASGCADLVLVIVTRDDAGPTHRALGARLAHVIPCGFRRVLPVPRLGRRTPVTAPVDCRDLWRGAVQIRCQTMRQGGYAQIPHADIDTIKSHQLDFVIGFQSDRLCGDGNPCPAQTGRWGPWERRMCGTAL
jgi:hypothetical protein